MSVLGHISFSRLLQVVMPALVLALAPEHSWRPRHVQLFCPWYFAGATALFWHAMKPCLWCRQAVPCILARGSVPLVPVLCAVPAGNRRPGMEWAFTAHNARGVHCPNRQPPAPDGRQPPQKRVRLPKDSFVNFVHPKVFPQNNVRPGILSTSHLAPTATHAPVAQVT